MHSILHTCHMHSPSYSLSFDNPNIIWWTVQIMKYLITQFSPIPFYFVPLRHGYYPQHSILDHPQHTTLTMSCLTPSDVTLFQTTFNPWTLNPQRWKIGCAPNNASRWKMGFNSAFEGLNVVLNPICPLLALFRANHIPTLVGKVLMSIAAHFTVFRYSAHSCYRCVFYLAHPSSNIQQFSCTLSLFTKKSVKPTSEKQTLAFVTLLAYR